MATSRALGLASVDGRGCEVMQTKFIALCRREETFDRNLVAGECVGPLVVDPKNVVDLKLDRGNCGPAFDDLNESAQRMCCREPFMMAAPAVTLSELCRSEMRPETGNGERKRQTRSANCANSS